MTAMQSSSLSTNHHEDHANPLQFSVGQTLDEVMQAWEIVYDAYRRLKLIAPNPWGVHCTPHAFTNDTAVIRGCLQGRCVTTLTAYLDDPEHGLPLDAVYPDTLAQLRERGCDLIELGLLADRRADIRRPRSSLMELIRWATCFGLIHGARQAIIGVHPHHAKFYAKCLGFQIVGKEKNYSQVNGAPVVPLLMDWQQQVEQPDQTKIPRGVRQCLDEPLPAESFTQRNQWRHEALTAWSPYTVLASTTAYFKDTNTANAEAA